jgi:K+-transporting ATPase ATPase B chain
MKTNSKTETPKPKKLPHEPTRSRHRQEKRQKRVNTQGLYQRAIKEAFIKLNPQIMLKNPVMFVVWVFRFLNWFS